MHMQFCYQDLLQRVGLQPALRMLICIQILIDLFVLLACMRTKWCMLAAFEQMAQAQTCTTNATHVADCLTQTHDTKLLLFVAQYRNPKDPDYKTSMKFPPPGIGKCFCFPCPAGFKTTLAATLAATGAAALNSPAAACLPTQPSCSLLVHYQLTASRSNGNPCATVATAAAGEKLLAALKQRTNAGDKSIVMFINCTVAKVGGLSMAACQLSGCV
jgi:hypothetical protein